MVISEEAGVNREEEKAERIIRKRRVVVGVVSHEGVREGERENRCGGGGEVRRRKGGCFVLYKK